METDIFSLHSKGELESFLEDTENKLYYLNKQTTRIGATTAYTQYLCEYAKEKDKRLLILEPTNAIIEGTVIPAYPEIYWLKKNEDLCLSADVKHKHRHFIKVFGYLPKTSECNQCEFKDECERIRIKERISEENLIATTYAKIYFDKKMLELINPDIILMDEFQWIDKYEVYRFTKSELTKLLKQLEAVQSFDKEDFLNTKEGLKLIELIKDTIEERKGLAGLGLKPAHFLNAINSLITKEAKAILAHFAKAWHSYHRFNYYGEEVIIPNYKTPIEYILDTTRAKVLIISMSEFQWWMLKEYFDRGGEALTIDLPSHPNEQSQLVICDSGSHPLMYYASTNRYNQYNEEIKNIESFVKTLNSFIRLENALLFAPNIKVRNNLRYRLKGIVRSIESFDDVREGKESKEAFLDYARSSTSGGIETGKRLGFLINLPWTPSDAFEDREIVSDIPSDLMRDDEISYALKNCFGRLKDPFGKKPSIVFIYGARKEDVLKFYPEKKEIVEIRQRRNVDRVNQILSEVIEYTFLWYRLLGIAPDALQYERMQYVELFHDIDMPAIHRKIWDKVKKGEDARYSDFDSQIKDLDKWHEIEKNIDVLYVLGILRSKDEDRFTLPNPSGRGISGYPLEANIVALEILIDDYIYGRRS